jgi:hypothetical protein
MPNLTNSMSDPDGRLWGWTAGANCAFKDAYGLPVYYPEYFNNTAGTDKEFGNRNDRQVLPSAGGVNGLRAMVSEFNQPAWYPFRSANFKKP